MADATESEVGVVGALWRYPVKSMMGEELPAGQVTEHGLVGDRVYGLVDGADGKIATAKNPGKWPALFAFHAAFMQPPGNSEAVPPVRVTLPDGTVLISNKPDFNHALSKALNRDVTLKAIERGQGAKAEEYWPDIEGLDHKNTVTDFELPAGTFFDCARVHLLTTTTLDRLRSFYPQGRFDAARFRPNIVVDAVGGEPGFPEQAWIGHTLAIGDDVRLSITGPCGRCVMVTLAQGVLPKDSGILRTAVQHNHGYVGVYAAVVRGGAIRHGDRVRLAHTG